jgi:methyl-accepting chemotaxis protein
MNIKHKLWLGFGLILVLFSGLSLYLNLQLGKLGDQATQAAEYPLEAVNNSRAAWDAFRDSRDLVAIELAAIEFSDSTEKSKQLLSQKDIFHKYLSNAEAAALFLKSETDFEEIRSLSNRWYDLNEQRIGDQLLTSLPDERVLTVLDKQLFDALQMLVKDSLNAAMEQKESTSKNITTTQSISITAMLATLIIGGLIAVFITINLQKPLAQLMLAVKDLARGEADLTKRLNLKSNDEIGQLSNELNIFIDRIHHLVQETNTSVNESCMTLMELSKLTEETNDGAVHQKDRLTDTVTTIEDLGSSIYQVRDNSQHAKSQVQEINKDTQDSLVLVQEAATGINNLATEVSNARDGIQLLAADSNSISELINVIDEIADQTNLLALNAAIEAARAGEAGRGFAVVADEVRALAIKTRESTENIQKTICSIKTQVDSARDVMENGRELAMRCIEQSSSVTQSLESVGEKVTDIEEMNLAIADQTNQQSNNMENIDQQMNAVKQIALDTESRTQELSTARLKLASALTKVEDNMGQFKL